MIEALIALLFGLIIGSFLNVCIYRWPRDLSVVRPRSHCVACEKTIAWYDNIPVLSYFALRGRCRHCGTRIALRYPAVELLTGLVFFYFVWTLGATAGALKMCLFAALLVGLIFADLEERILPDELTLGGTLAGILFALVVPIPNDLTADLLLVIARVEISGKLAALVGAALGALVPALFLWAGGWLYYHLRHREGLGLGDVKLIAMVGSFLGLYGAVYTLMLGSLAGAAIGYGYIKLTGRDPASYELPFGTFLGAAALLTAIGGKFGV
ncbi:MAG TPA: prepilin peptidase [Bryobacteraceae bacterium]|nr:prepilin peptidase [Bryobacteraceae bacterium]